MSSLDSNEIFKFEAEICGPKKLIPMLRSIQIMKTTVMAITRHGLKLTCQESSRCLQANSFIDRSLFRTYHMSDEGLPQNVCFKLSDLLHVLTVLTPNTSGLTASSTHSLRISYTGDSPKIKLLLREESVETKAYIQTFECEELIMFTMNFVNKVIINSEPIIDFWRSADLNSDYIEIAISEREPYLQWTTQSERAKVNHKFYKDMLGVELYTCSKEVSNRYKMSLIKFTLRALIHSFKLSIRTDDNGLLSLQFMIKMDENDSERHCFVEYFIVPEIDVAFLDNP